MKITNRRLCTNTEAFALLSHKDESQLTEVEKNVKEYLENYYPTKYNEHKAKEAIKKMQGKSLTRQEIFQMINLQPRKPVELFLIIKECEVRYSEKEQEELLNLIQSLK